MRIDIGNLNFIDEKLRKLLLEIELKTGYDFTITSLYRIGDPGVHGALPLRGTDLRMRNLEIGKAIAKLVNDHWTYDPNQPGKLCGLLHGSGFHLHLHVQVHPNTVQK